MNRVVLVAAMLAVSSSVYAADGGVAYQYSGSHAGGPANALIPEGRPLPVRPVARNPAYTYSGTHTGGPADALIPEGKPLPVRPVVRNPAYEFSGTHTGGPADALIQE